jgi:hypothetical protein
MFCYNVLSSNDWRRMEDSVGVFEYAVDEYRISCLFRSRYADARNGLNRFISFYSDVGGQNVGVLRILCVTNSMKASVTSCTTTHDVATHRETRRTRNETSRRRNALFRWRVITFFSFNEIAFDVTSVTLHYPLFFIMCTLLRYPLFCIQYAALFPIRRCCFLNVTLFCSHEKQTRVNVASAHAHASLRVVGSSAHKRRCA